MPETRIKDVDQKMSAVAIVLDWLFGTVSGALWMTALERLDYKGARVYGRWMLAGYSLCLLMMILAPYLS